jgi:hypothetical protein
MKALRARRVGDDKEKDFYFNEDGKIDYTHIQLWADGQSVEASFYDQGSQIIEFEGIPIYYNCFIPEDKVLKKNKLHKWIRVLSRIE